jgi:hypothetical protein
MINSALREKIKDLKRNYRFEVVKQIEDVRLNWSASIAMDTNGFMYLPAYHRDEILCYDRELNFVKAIEKTQGPLQLVIIKDNLYVLENRSKKIQVISREGVLREQVSLGGEKDVFNDIRIFAWKDSLGILDRRMKTITLYDEALIIIGTLPCPDQPSEQMFLLKEIEGALVFALTTGQMFSWDRQAEKWSVFSKCPIGLSTKYLSDIIQQRDGFFMIDHSENRIYKFAGEKMLFHWKAPKKSLLKGVINSDYLYLTCSGYKTNGSGAIIKISI